MENNSFSPIISVDNGMSTVGKNMEVSGSFHFLDGGGEMADAIRAYDWTLSNLGPLDGWPPALKTALSMALNSKFPKCVVWGPDLITLPNDTFRSILGEKPPALGRSFRDVWSEAWQKIGPIANRAYAGEATFIEDFPLIIDRHGYPEQCYFTFCYSPIRDEDGIVRGMMDTVIETTNSVEAQKQGRLLNGELGHRIKNMFSVISAIINQTLSQESDSQARKTLEQRIGSLAQAQALLTGSHVKGADMAEVIEQALAPFRTGNERFHTEGPQVFLSSRQSLTLALAINELATNAIKYGSLSIPEGEVYVRWTCGRSRTDDTFQFIWTESGGPPVSSPTRKGFGSRIIEKVLAQDFGGEAALVHDPAGVRCELSTRMNQIGDEEHAT